MEPLADDEREFMDRLTTQGRDSLPTPRLWSDIASRVRSADDVDEAMVVETPRLMEIGRLYYVEEKKRLAR